MVRIVLFCHEAHPPGDLRHLRLPEAPGSDGGSAHPDTAGDEGLLRVVGDGVLVHRDAYLIQPVLILLAGEAKVPGVHQNQMVVRAAGDQPEALLDQLFRQNPGVGSHLPPIGPELRLQRLAQAHGLGGDDMLQRTALCAGEHGGVDLFVQVVVIAQDHAAPGTPQCLVGGGGHHIGVGDGGGMNTGGHQTRNVGHVHHQPGAHRVGDLPELGKVQGAGIGAGPCQDQLGAALLGDGHHLLVVDGLCVVRHAIGNDAEIFAGDVHRAAVAQMAAMGQIHTEHCVTGLQQGKERRQIGVGAGVGLDIGVRTAKQLTGPLPRQLLRHVHGIAASVIPLSGIALRILIGETSAHGQQDGLADDVLGGDQLNVVLLPVEFLLNRCPHLGVGLGEKVHDVLDHCRGPPSCDPVFRKI